MKTNIVSVIHNNTQLYCPYKIKKKSKEKHLLLALQEKIKTKATTWILVFIYSEGAEAETLLSTAASSKAGTLPSLLSVVSSTLVAPLLSVEVLSLSGSRP